MHTYICFTLFLCLILLLHWATWNSRVEFFEWSKRVKRWLLIYFLHQTEIYLSKNKLQYFQLFILPEKANHFFYYLSRNCLPFSFTLISNDSKLPIQCNSLIALACLLFCMVLVFLIFVYQNEFYFGLHLNFL